MLLAGFASSADTPAPEAAPTPLTWTGCDISKKAYMHEAVAAYERRTGIRIQLTGGGATRGIRTTVGGASNIGGSCRHTLPERFPEDEAGAQLTVVAWDALVFFTHPSNSIDSITSEQARSILLGEITNWAELGGVAARIVPALRQQTVQGKLSGVGYMTRLLLFGDPNIEYTHQAIFHTSSGPIEEYVEAHREAFAVTGVSSARKRAVKIIALDGIEPSRQNIASGRYPLFRPLFLVTRSEPQGATRGFLDWIIGPEGQRIVSGTGTVNLAEGRKLMDMYSHWPEDQTLVRNR